MSCLIVGDEWLLWVVHRNPSSEIRMTVGLTSVTGACARPAFANSSRSASSGARGERAALQEDFVDVVRMPRRVEDVKVAPVRLPQSREAVSGIEPETAPRGREYWIALELESQSELDLPGCARDVRRDVVPVGVLHLEEVRVRWWTEAAVVRRGASTVVCDGCARQPDVIDVEDIEDVEGDEHAVVRAEPRSPLRAEIDFLERLVPEPIALERHAGGAYADDRRRPGLN